MTLSRRTPAGSTSELPVPLESAASEAGCVALLLWMLRHETSAQEGREEGFVRELARYLAERGIASRVIRGDSGRANLVARLDSGKPGPHLVFCGHCDTVPLGGQPWRRAPFGGEIDDGRIYGRGSSDMKGGLAALVSGFLDLAAMPGWVGRLSLAVTYGEETGSEGARLMAGDGSLGPFDAMIIAEPTRNRPVRSHKGAFWLRAVASGRSGHGSMPEMGVNALDLLSRLAHELRGIEALGRTDPLLGRPTVCLTRMEGGTQVNVIPDHAVAELDLRSLPGQDHAAILDEVRAVASRIEADAPGGKIVIEPIHSMPALSADAECPLVQAALETRRELGLPEVAAGGASYFTDGSILQNLGSDILILGPGDPGQAHQTDESLDLADLHIARRIYVALARRLLSTSRYALEGSRHDS